MVRSDVAKKQEDEDKKKAGIADTLPGQSPDTVGDAATGAHGKPAGYEFRPIPEPPQRPKRFFGSVELEPTRVGRDASRIAEEIVGHLVNLPGAKVKISIDIEASNIRDVPSNTQRTVTENAHTLHFSSFGFEDE